MLLSAFHRSVRTRAFAMLLAVAVCGATFDWGHSGWDDPACDPAPVLHNAAAHRLTGDGRTPAAPADHCSLCHFIRLLHTALSLASLPASQTHQAAAARAADGVPAIVQVALHLPSRAPPALLG